MKRKEVEVVVRKVIDAIDKLSDIEIGDCIYNNSSSITPYGKIMCIGYDSVVIKWFLTEKQIKDEVDEFEIIYDTHLGGWLFTLVDQKEVMAWLI